MATKQEQILAAVADALADVEGVEGRVYRSRQEAFSRSESGSVVIEPGPDAASVEPVSICRIDWTFTLVIAVYARGEIPDQVADPIIESVHSLLMADRTLGGLAMDVIPMSRDPQFDKGDLATAWIVLSYRIRYRTSLTDLSV
jgi:hypothetical protein